ncbi:MAG: IS481 family transposase [Coraliomargarita sp.]
MESRASFISDYLRDELSFSELCRRHGISRKTGYKWRDRYKESGLQGLLDRSRAPRCSPSRSPEATEQAVLKVREEHPVWGGRKIRRVMANEGFAGSLPAPSTISNILRRHGLLGGGTREGSKPLQRFERDAPNDLWQMDFKGWIRLGNGKRCHPLTILDDHSRFNISLEACGREDEKTVRPLLKKAFRRYGLPRQILCDHGSPWGTGVDEQGRQIGTPKLEVWLMRLGVELIHGRVRHPQTQGKEERFHRSLNAEVLKRESLWRDLQHCQSAFEHWQRIYNEKRPHDSLGEQTPSSRYQLSTRSFPEILPKPESFYLDGDELRPVKSKGEITFKNHFFYIGSAYTGSPVALRPRAAGVWEVYYCWKSLGLLNINNTTKKKGRYHRLTKQQKV